MLVVSPDYSPSAPEVGPFIPALLPRLEDEDLSVRRLAALLLMGRPDHAEIIVPALIHAAERRDEGGAVAVRSLNWYAHVSPEAVRWVVNALESDAPFMKDGVARAIVTLPPHSPPGQTLARSPEFRRAVVAYNGSEGSKLLSWLRHAVRDGASDPR
jgi:(2Fe-2S) ferredoxin